MIMRSVCTPSRCNHMNLVHTHHQSRMNLVCYIDYVYLALDTHTSRRDHTYMTRCYTRMQTRSQSRTWVSWMNLVLCYYNRSPTTRQGGSHKQYL